MFEILVKIFYKSFKVFQKSLMSTFLLNVPPQNQNPGAAPA